MRIGLAGLLAFLAACSPHADVESGSEGAEGTPGASSGTASGGASSGASGGEGASSSSSSSGGASSGGPDGGAAAEAKCTKSTKAYGGLGMWECVPTGMETKQATPAGLVVAMHGYTQGVVQAGSPGQAWGFKATSRWQALAEKHRFYVIYPDKGSAAFQWYAFFGTSGIGRNDLEPSSIKQMVDDMRAKYNIAPDKVFVNGLSAGAYMAVVMLATYPDVFAGGATFAGGAYGCGTNCAALGKKGNGWTWPGNHASTLVTNAHSAVWKDAAAKKPRLMIFQGEADGAVTSENLADLTQQWKGAAGITGAGTSSTLKGHTLTEYTKDGNVALATVSMKGIGHGTPVDPGSGSDQGGWDPNPSQQAANDPNAVQDWTNTAGLYGPYYAAKFFGLAP